MKDSPKNSITYCIWNDEEEEEEEEEDGNSDIPALISYVCPTPENKKGGRARASIKVSKEQKLYKRSFKGVSHRSKRSLKPTRINGDKMIKIDALKTNFSKGYAKEFKLKMSEETYMGNVLDVPKYSRAKRGERYRATYDGGGRSEKSRMQDRRGRYAHHENGY
ncbi:hypothetical protein M9H77_02929 [Catharanthus roseus]|uniref:Uncharacterized protein n=1 Tax=Catharanthus roseus TaxID=4058 RepID=A0ACC0CAA6_CATRO|nr:hypothetical protein M9H77_02929 [Catharanthus roseus]